ncbi:leukocyte elastase inhibitor-like [Sphaerodactylus townsendi]|uniref:Uncharacterized protein n=1 Tax=Sphaerodactylus townsendi TaxID=933632 RepID=A0ACB8FCE0_9SAUR|nr:leukocyte elastase inhibitor-like [Sphaerodactylus townsendi]XP_048363088.1 leukocyte elastase inhibitor-like [Sphaerodactylus townsendi]
MRFIILILCGIISPTMGSLVDSNTRFAVDVLKMLHKENPKQNVITSPFSVSAALSMVLYGAKKNTAAQMEKVLHIDKITGSGKGDSPGAGAVCDKPGGPHSQFKTLLSAINTHTKNYALSVANRIYGAKRFEFEQQYLRCTKELYGAELERVDFQHALEETRKKINAWVEKRTNNKIKGLFAPGAIDESAALILVNAIYFQGKWQRAFNKTNTQEKPFWISENQSKKVPMMYQKHKFNWAEIKNPKIKLLELPYDNKDLSMIILLPEDKGGLDQVVKGLSYDKVQEWTRSSNMKEEKIEVYLPKFKLEGKYALGGTLGNMGMTDVFTPGKADLSGMSKSSLVVSKVIHQAFIEVNEEGTEAAAATGVEVVPVSARIYPKVVADRPFLFFIRHNKSQSILFSGTVVSP